MNAAVHGRPRRRRSTPFDIALGQRIRQLRLARGMSQVDVGDKLGVSFQQIQKYENGTNAIASGRMNALCDALGVSPNELYEADMKAAAPTFELSTYALRMAQKLDKLTVEQRRAVAHMLKAFGVEDD